MKQFSTFLATAGSALLIAATAVAQDKTVMAPVRLKAVERSVHAAIPADPMTKATIAVRRAAVAFPHARIHQDVPHSANLRGGGPANDLCANATTLAVNQPGSCPGQATSGDNSAAGNDNGTPECDVTTVGFQDVWYSFNSGANTTVQINLEMGTIADIGVEVLEGGCNGTSVFCDFTALQYNVTVQPSTAYRVRVFSNNEFGAGGTFDICLSSLGAAPANDLCDNVVAQSLAVGGSVIFNGDNTGATDSEGLGASNVWEAFTLSTCANLQLSYCGTDPVFGNAFLELNDGCPATALFPQSSFDQTTCADGNVTIFYTEVPAGTWYYPVLMDASATGPYTITISATACAGPDVYCSAGAVVTTFEKISNVTFAGIDNASTSGAGYENFTAQTAIVGAGQSYNLGVELASGFATDQVLAWIDFDQNEVFDNDELVFESAAGAGPFTGNVAIPSGATLGTTRMRIRLHDTYAEGVEYQNTPNPTPCDTSTYGQVEDYTVLIEQGATPPANDQCANIIPTSLSVGGTINFSGDNTGATMTNDYAPGSPLEGEGLASVWHAFTITECATVTLSYCGTDPAFANVWIVIATECPADALVFSDNFENTTCADGNFTVGFSSLPAGTYYVPVMNDPGSSSVGPYTIEVSAVACPNAPANDLCEGAIGLDVNTECEPITGTVFGGTQSLPAIECNTFTGDANDDVWYAFAATSPNALVSVLGSTSFDAVIEVFEAPCTDLASIACSDSSVAGETEAIAFSDLTIGNTYYIRVYDYANGYPATPEFDICVTGDVPTAIVDANTADFTMRPNPADGQVVIELPADLRGSTIELLDLSGRLVMRQSGGASAGAAQRVLEVSGLGAGLYTVRVLATDRTAEARLLVR